MTSVLVDKGVPYEMQIFHTANLGHFLQITTSVTIWEFFRYHHRRVQRLVHIANVVNYEAQGE